MHAPASAGPRRCDVAILGAGPAGLATAIALKRHDPDCSVAVLSRPTPTRARVGETLPPGARSILARLGLWEDFAAAGHRPTHASRAAWGAPEPHENEFIYHPEQHGWLLDRPRFEAQLAAAARQLGCHVFTDLPALDFARSDSPPPTDSAFPQSGASPRCGASPWSGERTRPGCRVGRPAQLSGNDADTTSPAPAPANWLLRATLPDGEPLELHADFLVDASGRAALVAERQGAARIADDRLVACTVCFRNPPAAPAPSATTSSAADSADTLAATAASAAAHAAPHRDPTPLVEAGELGWWFSAPLPDGRHVVTFFTDADLARPLRLRDTAAWSALLAYGAPLTHRRLADAIPDGPVQLRPADSVILDRLTGDDWLAVGDAASTFDPLSSHGIVKALRHAGIAAYAIADHRRGAPLALAKYAALLRREFAEFLDAKRGFYREETRWPDSPFWRRRHARVWLSPEAKLERAAPRPGPTALHLSPAAHARLWHACEGLPASREVLTRFARGDATPADSPAADPTSASAASSTAHDSAAEDALPAILALQHLVEEGALLVHA